MARKKSEGHEQALSPANGAATLSEALKGDEPSFEELLSELEQVVARLQEGGLRLEEAIELYERGVKLAKLCDQRLSSAELRIRELQAGLEGEPPAEEE